MTAYLCARALGAENVHAIRMPYKSSSAASLADAQLVIDALGIHARTIEITGAVDGYLQFEPDADARRRGKRKDLFRSSGAQRQRHARGGAIAQKLDIAQLSRRSCVSRRRLCRRLRGRHPYGTYPHCATPCE